MKKRILLLTNPPWLKTGLAENAKTLLKHLWKTGKYEIAQYCSQVSENDPSLKLTPWKSFGCLPADQQSINQLNQDQGRARDASYGAWYIDRVVREWKPDILLCSDDIWAFPKHAFMDKPWWKQISGIIHVTVDSLPVLEQAFEQSDLTKSYFTWAKFASDEMKRAGPKFAHVKQIYGAMDTTKFSPITPTERAELRKRFGIKDSTTVFLFVGRNQLRKQFVQCLEAFAHFKRENPQADTKLWFHTSYSEKAQGWDIVKMARYYGVNMQDILATYVCKHCGEWFVNPYMGEDLNCPICKTEKSLITVNIVNGVPDHQMRLIYGISDACVSAFSSGGLEYHNVQSLLCAKPLASTNYSSGVDFCEQDFVFTLGFTTYTEQGTNFIKATTGIQDIKRFFHKVWKAAPMDLVKWGERGRVWATKTFGIDAIGAQWEAVFDVLPKIDWSIVNMETPPKDDKFPFPQIEDADKFLTALYTGVLRMEERPDGEGRKHWHAKLKEGMKREDIYNFFLSVARDENGKNNAAKAGQDFWNQLDLTTGRPRALFIIKESFGDCLLTTQLFESFHEQYPAHDLYVACEGKFAEVFSGNPYVFKTLQYQAFMESEMACIGAGQTKDKALFNVYFHPAIQSQRQLNYLSANKIAHQLT